MKKIFLLLSVFVMALGCSDEIQTNTPVIQGKVNDQFFRAKPATGSISPDGTVKLIGADDSREITLQMASALVGQYPIVDTLPANQATFKDVEGDVYVAGGGLGSGMIEIVKNTGSTVSGTFFFNAVNGAGATLNFRKGVFFEVPITNATGGGEEGPADFLEADIDDVPFEASLISITKTDGNITVLGTTQNTSIQLMFSADIATGENPLTAEGIPTASYGANLNSEAVETGTLTITSNDTTTQTINGTFEFTTATSGTVINNGSFQITYQ